MHILGPKVRSVALDRTISLLSRVGARTEETPRDVPPAPLEMIARKEASSTDGFVRGHRCGAPRHGRRSIEGHQLPCQLTGRQEGRGAATALGGAHLGGRSSAEAFSPGVGEHMLSNAGS